MASALREAARASRRAWSATARPRMLDAVRAWTRDRGEIEIGRRGGGFATTARTESGEESSSSGTNQNGAAIRESVSLKLGRDGVETAIAFETGRLARLADGAVMASMGDNRVMCAAVAAREPDPNAGFFPLNVEYRERASAYGKIPSTFTRREGAPKDREVLAMRVVDRAIRPLFPKAFRNDTSVQAIVLASDRSLDPIVLAVNGASAALHASSIPWNGPVGAVRVAVVNDGEVIVTNPDDATRAESEFELLYAGTEDRALMIEASATKRGGVPEAVVAKALRAAHDAAKLLIAPQRRLRERVGKEKRPLPEEADATAAAAAKLKALAVPRLTRLYELKIQSKSERGRMMAELKAEIAEELATSHGMELTPQALDAAYLAASSRAMRDLVFEKGVRVDGRKLTELRSLAAEVGAIPVVHGSSVFERGNTQALATVTIGSVDDFQRLDAPVGPKNKKFMLHYAFPSFSINETPRRGGLSRREIGHGALAEKSLAGMIPDDDAYPFAVRVNAETLESNGSSSMAAVCAGSLALMDAGVPIAEHVGAISVGLVMDEDEDGNVTRHALLSDIMGLEDVLGDMDFKIAGTRGGITGIQLDCKPQGIPLDILCEALDEASVARNQVIDEMYAAIARPREADEMSAFTPRYATLEMDQKFVGKLIGPQGSTIKNIEATTSAKISIRQAEPAAGELAARVGIFAPSKDALALAVEQVELLTKEVEKGATYGATVIDTKPFGWIVRAPTGCEGLLHVTEYSWDGGFISESEVESLMPVGTEVEVKCVDVKPGRNGKTERSFSVKQLTPPPEGHVSPPPKPRIGMGRGARGSSAGQGSVGGVAADRPSIYVRNPDGTLKKPLQRIADAAK